MNLANYYDETGMSDEQKKEARAFRDSVCPPELYEASNLYQRTMYKVLICLEEAEIDFKKAIDVLKKHNDYKGRFAMKAIKKQMRILESQVQDDE